MFNADLPGLIRQGEVLAPESIVLHGFDLDPPPMVARVIEAFANTGSEVRELRRERRPTVPLTLHRYPLAEDELRGAMEWARNALEQDSDRRIAVVVPNLAGSVETAERIAREVFDPAGFRLQESDQPAWHISLGKPLDQWPLIRAALNVLSLEGERISQPQARQITGSAFFAGWQNERAPRYAALQDLARYAPYHLTIHEWRRAAERAGAPELANLIQHWRQARARAPVTGPLSQWVGQFQQELAAAGFARGRGLDSREYQTLQRWHELLESISALDAVMLTPLSRRQALQHLQERAAATVFRERNAGAALEILGVEEAIGSRFDALWITAMDSATWPGATRRHPLLPGPIQSSVPRATSAGSLAHARNVLAILTGASDTVITSMATGSDEIPLSPCTLLPYEQIVDHTPAYLIGPAPLEQTRQRHTGPGHCRI